MSFIEIFLVIQGESDLLSLTGNVIDNVVDVKFFNLVKSRIDLDDVGWILLLAHGSSTILTFFINPFTVIVAPLLLWLVSIPRSLLSFSPFFRESFVPFFLFSLIGFLNSLIDL